MSKPEQSQSQGSPRGKGKANKKQTDLPFEIPSTLQKKPSYAEVAAISKPEQSQSQGSPRGKGKANKKQTDLPFEIPSTLQKKASYAEVIDLCDVQLANEAVVTWVKSCLALKITSDVIRTFVVNKITEFHKLIKSKFPEGVKCMKCKVNVTCPKDICHSIQRQIQEESRNRYQSFDNTDITRWLEEPWEIAKCYMPPSYGSKNSSASTADFTACVNVIINCNRIWKVLKGKNGDINDLYQSRNFRNHLAHDGFCNVEEQYMKKNLDTLIRILDMVETTETETNDDTENARTAIRKMKTTQMQITTEMFERAKEAIADENEQDELHFGDLTSAESLAHGQVFSHFTGFLRKVLPVFPKLIKTEAEKKGLPLLDVCEKYFILLPGSCKIRDTLVTKEGSNIAICHVSSLEKVDNHAGKERKYKLSLYSISNGEKKFYFVADFPNVLGTICQLKELEMADVNPKIQIARFYFKLNELINHSKNVEFSDTVQIVIFNDEKQRLEDVLFQEMETSPRLQKNPNDNRIVSQGPTRTSTHIHSLLPNPPEQKADAYISYFEDEESKNVVGEIRKHLEETGKCVAEENPGISWYEQLARGKWVIFVISRKFVTSNSEALECMSALGPGIVENNLRILPVICEEAAVERIPGFAKFIMHVCKTEPDYLKNIVQIMNGDPIRKCDKIPCGDVATGLACAYVLDYLVLTLLETGFVPRIRRFLRDKKIEEKGEVKLIILVPKTCRVPDSVLKEAENCRDSNRSIELLGDLEPTTMNQGGQHGRTYYLHMFRFTNHKTGIKKCLVCEYATPSKCLHDMAHEFPFVGLEKEQMYEQAERFVIKTRDILKRDTVKNGKGDVSSLVDLVYFDDEKENLLDVIERTLDAGKYKSVPKSDSI